MACTGHVNSCLTHAGYVGPRTTTVWTDPTLNTSITIQATHFNQLRTAITNELAVRGLSTSGMYAAQSAGNLIYSVLYKGLRSNMERIDAAQWAAYSAVEKAKMNDATLAIGQLIEDTTTTAFRTYTNYMESLCVCDCNYACTCDCNYCTCDCANACECQSYTY
jgi:hypothetical protein